MPSPPKTCSRCSLPKIIELNSEPLCQTHLDAALAEIGDRMEQMKRALDPAR